MSPAAAHRTVAPAAPAPPTAPVATAPPAAPVAPAPPAAPVAPAPPASAAIAAPTRAAALRAGIARLGDSPVESPRLDAELLLAHVLGLTRSQVLTHPQAVLEPEDAARFAELIERRRSGEPVAYLRGVREFWSLELEVSPAVLVPRPETERLVEAALERCPATSPVHIADLGTGSGAVAIALARERPRALIVATDASPEALAVAGRNAAHHAPGRIALRLGRLEDWYAPLAGEVFDLIVSNPPYIAANDPALAELAAEPRPALIAGPTGLEALGALIAGAPAHLAPGGTLLLEHGSAQGEAVAAMLAAHGFTGILTLADAGARPRVTLGVHPSATARTRP